MIKDRREDKAQSIAIEEGGLEYVLDTTSTPDYVEVVGKKGDDIITYHVMNDGQIYYIK